MYIRCNSEDGITDIEYFDLPNFLIARIKKFICNTNPELIHVEDEDEYEEACENFYYDSYALQRIFNDLVDIKEYLEESIDSFPEADSSKLQYVLERINQKLEPDLYRWDYSMTSNYEICHVDPFGGTAFPAIQIDDIESAITKWFQLETKYPSCVAICAKNRKYAKELRTWVRNNKETLLALWNKYNVPYSFEYLYGYCIEHNNDNARAGDQVEPFAAG